MVSLRHQDFITRWMLSAEYCAWIYYTPDHKYEISRLTVAFFARDSTNPTCDGFYQYVPASGGLYKWADTGNGWACRKTGVVTWQDEENYTLEQVDAPCPDFNDMGAP